MSTFAIPIERKGSSKTKSGAIAQLVEQRTENPCVPGSIPGGTTENLSRSNSIEVFFVWHTLRNHYFLSRLDLLSTKQPNLWTSYLKQVMLSTKS